MPVAIIATAIIVAIPGFALVPSLLGPGDDGRSWYAVTFSTVSNEADLGSGNLAYDDQTSFELNLTEERMVRVECRLEWSDQGNTPVNDPYVDLFIFNATNDIVAVAEIRAPGGVIRAYVYNQIPENATVKAHNEGEAISLQTGTVNNTSEGMGLWRFGLSAQAPSRVRPFAGATIHYQLWVSVFTYEGLAVVVPGE
jgi:hypothetical protein